ncbi:AKT-interacting protein [Aphelenchoides bicaudatus]|nr:AKT-interacting protein [Aphelenchoides bicaudatus]
MDNSNVPRLNLNAEEEEHSDLRVSNASIEINPSTSTLGMDSLQRRNLFIIMEFEAICKRPLEGTYVRPSDNDILELNCVLEWFGIIVIKTGVFAGGIFRFNLTLPSTFPDTNQVPTIEMEQSLLHPLIFPKTNRVDFRRFFPSGWKPDRNHVHHVLQAFQSIFYRYQCEVEVAANPEAAILWKDDRKHFKKLANIAVRESRTQIYDPPKTDDPQALRFKPWDAGQMEPILNVILNKADPSKELAPLLSKEKNPYASFFKADKAFFLCDVLDPVTIVESNGTDHENEQEEVPQMFYEEDEQSD